MSATGLAMEEDAELLLAGEYGTLNKIPLAKAPPTTLRPGEEASVYTRVLSTIRLGKREDPVLALHRFKIWWIRPTFGHPIPPETVLLLDRVHGGGEELYRLVLTVVLPLEKGTSFASSSVRGRLVENTAEEEELLLCGNCNQAAIYLGIGPDPYALIQEGATLATRLWKDEKEQHDSVARKHKNNNVALNKLGFCTWNAFYTKVNGNQVVQAMRSLQEDHKIPIRWMIFDDGWQHITHDSEVDDDLKLDGYQWSQRMQSFREDPVKFQDLSLKDSIERLRSDLGIEAIWVWHTLAGYWLGIKPESPPFSDTCKLQYAHFPPGILDNDASASLEPSIDQGIGITTNARVFFQQYHSDFLSGVCNVDGIKVDAQGVVGILKPSKANGASPEGVAASGDAKAFAAPVIALHDALAESVSANFAKRGPADADGNQPLTKQFPSIIHCMAHAPEIFYRLPSLYQRRSAKDEEAQGSPFFRVADDFYPDNPNSHGPQIVACAYNSLLFQHVAQPDWDMFATSSGLHPDILQCHAVARCISGGPIYFSSSPADLQEGRPDWIDWICCEDGTTLPCRGTALPVASCLLQDPLAPNAAPLVLWNTNGGEIVGEQGGSWNITSGILALFGLAGLGKWDYDKLTYVGHQEKGEQEGDKQQEDSSLVEISPTLVPHFGTTSASTKFLATFFFSQSAHILPTNSATMHVPVKALQSEVVILYPILQWTVEMEGVGTTSEVVVVGFEGKLNAAGAVESTRYNNSNNSIDLTIRGCGTLLVLLRNTNGSRPSGIEGGRTSVEVDGVKAMFRVITDHTELAALDDVPTKRLRKELLRLGFSLLLVDLPCAGVSKQQRQVLLHLATRGAIRCPLETERECEAKPGLVSLKNMK